MSLGILDLKDHFSVGVKCINVWSLEVVLNVKSHPVGHWQDFFPCQKGRSSTISIGFSEIKWFLSNSLILPQIIHSHTQHTLPHPTTLPHLKCTPTLIHSHAPTLPHSKHFGPRSLLNFVSENTRHFFSDFQTMWFLHYFWQIGIHWLDTGSSFAKVIEIPAAGRPVDVSRTCDEIGSGCLAMIFYISKFYLL